MMLKGKQQFQSNKELIQSPINQVMRSFEARKQMLTVSKIDR